MEAHSKARLVEAPSMQSGVAATVSRSEIEETLSSAEGPAVLVLDIARRSGESETADVEAHTLEVELEKPDLDQILRTATGDAIEPRFDQGGLEESLDSDDVDAHGLREKALILTVAAATAAGAAGQASGMTVVDRGSGPASSISAPASTSSAPISDVVSGGPAGQAAAATPLVSDVVSGGPAGAEQSALASEAVSGGPERPRAAAATGDESTPLVSDVAGGGPAGQTAESTPLVSDVAGGGPAGAAAESQLSATSGGPEWPRAAAAAATEQTPLVTDVAGGGPAPAQAAESTGGGGGGITISSSEAIGAGIGGLALLITGASFAAARRQRPAL